jgi:hypothetical protein
VATISTSLVSKNVHLFIVIIEHGPFIRTLIERILAFVIVGLPINSRINFTLISFKIRSSIIVANDVAPLQDLGAAAPADAGAARNTSIIRLGAHPVCFIIIAHHSVPQN